MSHARGQVAETREGQPREPRHEARHEARSAQGRAERQQPAGRVLWRSTARLFRRGFSRSPRYPCHS